MKLKGLILPGYACTSQIWERMRTAFEAVYDATWVDYPHDLTPGLYTVSAFTDWLQPVFRKGNFDFIIGHSMGGLVALELAGREKAPQRKVILVETFLVSPGPFFQNLFLRTAPEEISKPITDMLEREKPHYSPRLKECLQDLEVHLPPAEPGTSIHALYSDRGCGDEARVVRELGWTEEFTLGVKTAVVKNACHFPMVENPGMTFQILKDILG